MRKRSREEKRYRQGLKGWEGEKERNNEGREKIDRLRDGNIRKENLKEDEDGKGPERKGRMDKKLLM